MTAFEDCINAALKAKKIKPEQRDRAIKRYRGARDRLIKEGHEPDAADVLASAEAIERATDEVRAAAKARLHYEAWKGRVAADLAKFEKGAHHANAAVALIEHNPQAPYRNFNTQRAVRRGELHTMLNELIEKYQPRKLGFHNPKAGQDAIGRALFGDAGDANATAFAKAWTTATNHTVDLWNMMGGTKSRFEDWHLPQPDNNAVKMMRARSADGKVNKWVDDAVARADWSRITHQDGSPVLESERRKFATDVFSTKITDGALKVEGHASPFYHTRERVMHWKSWDDWKHMHEQYGDGSLYDMMMMHVDQISHDLALLEVFGPMPEEGKEYVKRVVLKAAAERDLAHPDAKRSARVDAEERLRLFDTMWDDINGRHAAGAENTIAQVGGTTRNVLSGAMLGSALWTAFPIDLMSRAQANFFAGLPVTTGFKNYLKLMAGDPATKQIALTSGFVLDNVVSNAYSIERFTGMATTGAQWSKVASEAVMRASLLTMHTNNLRLGWALDTMGIFARSAKTAFEDHPLRLTFERHGIDAADWDALRATPLRVEKNGAEFLRPIDMLKASGKSREAIERYGRFQALLHDETRLAVPDVGIEAAVGIKGATRPGTIIGEVARSFAMFKNVPHQMLLLHGRRGMMEQGLKGRLGYYGSLGVMLTLAGAASTQMKELAQGREPVPMDSPAFWGKAMLAGGAMGVYGDFLFSGVNRFGHGPTETAAGPVVQTLASFTDLTFGNVSKAWQGKDTTVAADLINLASRTTPGTSLWYARLVLQRQMWDQLALEFDPKARSKFARRVTNQRREWGNDYWSKPGESLF